MRSTSAATRVALTDIPDSWRWMKPDLAVRLLPMAAAFAFVEAVWRPSWTGLSLGRLEAQLTFGAVTAPLLFVAATWVQLLLTRRRGAIGVPSGPGCAWSGDRARQGAAGHAPVGRAGRRPGRLGRLGARPRAAGRRAEFRRSSRRHLQPRIDRDLRGHRRPAPGHPRRSLWTATPDRSRRRPVFARELRDGVRAEPPGPRGDALDRFVLREPGPRCRDRPCRRGGAESPPRAGRERAGAAVRRGPGNPRPGLSAGRAQLARALSCRRHRRPRGPADLAAAAGGPCVAARPRERFHHEAARPVALAAAGAEPCRPRPGR